MVIEKKLVLAALVTVALVVLMFCNACSPVSPSSMCATMTGPGSMTIGALPVASCPDNVAQHKIG